VGIAAISCFEGYSGISGTSWPTDKGGGDGDAAADGAAGLPELILVLSERAMLNDKVLWDISELGVLAG
jgi:hypothetical protein